MKNLGWLLAMVICFGTLADVNAWQQTNPFEISNRIDADNALVDSLQTTNPFDRGEATTPAIVAVKPDPDNPFEIVKRTSGNSAISEMIVKQSASVDYEGISYINRIWLNVLGIVFFAILISLFRSDLRKVSESLINERKFNQLYRDTKGRIFLSHLSFYVLAIFQYTLFSFLFIKNVSLGVPTWLGDSFLLLFLFFLVLWSVKLIILLIIKFNFATEKECDRYILTLMIFNIILGICFIPINLMIYFGPVELLRILFWIGLLSVIIGTLFKALRGFSVASRMMSDRKFHFFLYLCTIEIAPLALIYSNFSQ